MGHPMWMQVPLVPPDHRVNFRVKLRELGADALAFAVVFGVSGETELENRIVCGGKEMVGDGHVIFTLWRFPCLAKADLLGDEVNFRTNGSGYFPFLERVIETNAMASRLSALTSAPSRRDMG